MTSSSAAPTSATRIRVERDGPILHVALARPDRRNALDGDLIDELLGAFADIGDARVVVLAGDGPSFCAGADIAWQQAATTLAPDENLTDYLRLSRALETVDACAAPVVARVQGHALGAGAGLVACADVAVAAPDAVFGFSEVQLGLVPAVVTPFALAAMGARAAGRYLVTGERFGADTALSLGFVHELARDLDAAVGRIVAAVLAGGPAAVRATKRLVREPVANREARARLSATMRVGAEGQEGLRAFLERREPAWRSL